MVQLRFALLNASTTEAAIPSTNRNFRRELDADLTEFLVSRGQLPDSFEFDGVIVTGSAASAYWEEDWIEDTREWIQGAHERGLPILGVCFGHQLLASALGGTVAEMDEFEIGYREVSHEDSPLFSGIDDRFTVFITHGDRVIELPDGGERIAENEYGVHGFRVGHAFGVQFHPEYDMETAAAVTRRKEFLGEDRIESVLAGITDEQYAEACQAKQLFDNFTEYAAQIHRTPA
ncbi:type 1 glutamine amidotransferase [Halocatena salina]|uniref:Type 1 glutamine amidotransferase n=1 Tax=Halocatena salina TaxID=2934340 RepID=A0A8T9ZZ13_9EURY|nr:type 1 glutamine amidotransferase [Halocatena salina]UPM42002.1 type 1 glutamine amidotransferase [Halocatena salina]